MRSVMKHRFSEVPSVGITRSRFNRSHGFKTTFDAGYLVPVLVDYCVPGDTLSCNMTGFARLSTPTYPIMDNMFLDSFFFKVPLRILWTNFKKQHGEREDPSDSIDYTSPKIAINNIANESLYDYAGLPTKISGTYNVNNYFGRAYNKIWNYWFRDENLQDSVTVDTDNGPDSISDYVLLRRNKRHDYFTSCLPWLQRGDAVLLSLGTSAPIIGDGSQVELARSSMTGSTNGLSTTNTVVEIGSTGAASLYVPDGGDFGANADLTNAVGPTINELREAITTQRLLEKDARSGTRYTEILQSHFQVTSPDGRLQEPEYLGGGSTPIHINPVARTDSSPGQLGAVGQVAFSNHGFTTSFTEHCIVIGLVNVRADLTYQEGIEKHWDIDTRYDWYYPVFSNLGEQAVLNREIYIDASTISGGTDDDVFGYQERWAHMRYKPSRITGKFRSNDTATLDAWHLGIEFGSQPTLDTSFIQDNPPIDRVIATPSEPHFIFDSYFNYQHTRPLPIYSVPGVDRM